MELRAAVLAGILFCVSYNVYAEPVMEASEDGVRIVLHNDKCALKEIANLPYKAVWHEKGQEVEGCWGGRPDAGAVIFYFADKTVALAPIQKFKRVIAI